MLPVGIENESPKADANSAGFSCAIYIDHSSEIECLTVRNVEYRPGDQAGYNSATDAIRRPCAGSITHSRVSRALEMWVNANENVKKINHADAHKIHYFFAQDGM